MIEGKQKNCKMQIAFQERANKLTKVARIQLGNIDVRPEPENRNSQNVIVLDILRLQTLFESLVCMCLDVCCLYSPFL